MVKLIRQLKKNQLQKDKEKPQIYNDNHQSNTYF